MGQNAALSDLFIPFTKRHLDGIIAKRAGETKLGETILFADKHDFWESIKTTEARFILIGIPEDIGVRANGGVGGAHTLWEPFLKTFLNTQSNEHIDGKSLLIGGVFDFKEWMKQSEDYTIETLRELVTVIDEAVFPVIEAIVAAGKIPIVIGGGHNNSYPLLKGCSLAKGEEIHCINLDAHSDYRVMEGRHSGNGFRYARHDGYLSRYAMVGLHRGYNSADVLKDIYIDDGLHCSFYEDIFIDEKLGFKQAIQAAINHTKDWSTGIELDLDCIENILSSAITPCGISVLQARQYLVECADKANVAYMHIAEGAIQLRDGRIDATTAKLVASLVRDFMTGFKRQS